MTAAQKIKFGTDGWRGIVAADFTFDNVRLVARAIGSYLRKSKAEGGVVIGYDARFLGPEFASACAEVLSSMGIISYHFDRPMPTPITAYTIKSLKAAGAIMLTASHNPPDYQGIKFIADYAGPAETEITSSIEREIDGGTAVAPAEPLAKSESISSLDSYWRHLSTLIDFELIKQSGLKIVVDPLYGAGVGLFSRWASELSNNVTAIHDTFDPLFGGLNPDPNEHNLEALTSDVVAGGRDIGLAIDGDGDRFGIVDSLGVYLSPNQVISLLAHYLLERRGLKGSLVRTVATTHLLDDIAADFGVDLIETPVGFKWICQEMRRRPVVIGGEESGGLSMLGHIPEKDGILACLLAAELTCANKKPLSKILSELYGKYGQRYGIRLDIHLPNERKKALLAEVGANPPEEVNGSRVAKVITTDGIKLVLDNGDWMLIRPSGTEPLVRIYLESTSLERFSRLEDYAQRIIK